MMLQLLEYNTWRYKLVFKSIEINSGKSLDFIADDIGLYFKSIKGTMCHMLVCDYIWYSRVQIKKENLQIPFNP